MKKTIAVLLTISLLGSVTATAEMIFASPPPVNRKFYPSMAQTLDNLPEQARARTDSLVIGMPDLLGETNPFWVRTTGDECVASLQFDELLFTSNDGEVGTGVAKVEVSADKRTFTFTMQEKVAYPDGTPVTSDDFINALYLLLMPGYDGAYDITRASIAGVEAYLDGESETISGISRVSDKAFTVRVDTPGEGALAFFSIPALRVSTFGNMHRPEALETYQEYMAFYQQSLANVRAATPTDAVYGQYVLDAIEPGKQASLTASKNYWRGAPYIDTVVVSVVPAGDELAAIMDGSIDIVSLLGSVDVVDTATDSGAGFVNLYTWTGDVIGMLCMDLANPIFADVNVRHALAIGLGRELANLVAIERYGKLPGALIFDSFDVTTDLLGEQYAYDPIKAAGLLDDAGWTLGDDGLRHKDGVPFRFTFTYNQPNPIIDRTVEQMREDFGRLGLDMTVQTVSFDELLSLIDQNACDMYFEARRLPWSAALAADLFVGDSHLNRGGYQSERLQRLLSWAQHEENPEKQTFIYESLFQELYIELPFIPLYRRSEMLLINARVMNITVTSAHAVTADLYRAFLVDTLKGQW